MINRYKAKQKIANIYSKFVNDKPEFIVIYFHDIVENGYGKGCQEMDIYKFREKIKFIKDEGYNTVSLYDLKKEKILNSILITFDDGFKSVYTKAFPILKEYKLKAGIFLNNDFVNQKNNNYLNWDEIKIMDKSHMISFGGHTKSHIDVRKIDETNYYEELKYSKGEIEERLGHEIDSLCFPYGKYNKKIIKRLKEDKLYRFIFTSDYRDVKIKNKEIQIIPRISISNDDNIKNFKAKLLGHYNYMYYIQKTRLFIENLI